MTSETVAGGTDVFAPAKINLTLHITGQRADGYHLLDSIVVFADVGDRLTIVPKDTLSLSVTGPFAAGVPEDHRNLVWQATEKAGRRAAITLEKNLPHGAGIGGGSTDGAAILRYFGAVRHAAALGADVPVCVRASAQRMQGIGEVLTPLTVPLLHAVLVNPGAHVPTPSVFKALNQKENPPMPEDVPIFGRADDFITWLVAQRNDLQEPALTVAPQIGQALNALEQTQGVKLMRMSGSGSTCFGLYLTPSEAAAAAQSLTRAYPDWWVKGCTLS